MQRGLRIVALMNWTDRGRSRGLIGPVRLPAINGGTPFPAGCSPRARALRDAGISPRLSPSGLQAPPREEVTVADVTSSRYFLHGISGDEGPRRVLTRCSPMRHGWTGSSCPDATRWDLTRRDVKGHPPFRSGLYIRDIRPSLAVNVQASQLPRQSPGGAGSRRLSQLAVSAESAPSSTRCPSG